MSEVEIYSKPDCHLCDVAKSALKKIQVQHPFILKEIFIKTGDANYEQLKNNIPVIYINKQFAFQHRINESSFLEKLKEIENG